MSEPVRRMGTAKSLVIVPASTGRRLSHFLLLAWLVLMVLFLLQQKIACAANYAYVVPKAEHVQEIKHEQAPNSSRSAIDQYITAVAQHHKVDPLLVRAVIQQESQFQPEAVSPKGAQGLMQLMPSTAQELHVNNPFDPLENIFGGTKYLKSLLDQYNGDVALSLAAYNAGPGTVNSCGGIPNYPETRRYVLKVLQGYLQLRSM